MSATERGEAQFVFDVSEPERKALEVALDLKQAKHLVTVQPKGDTAGGAHGELVTATIFVIAAKLVMPLVAGWLLSKAPPKPRKEIIKINRPDGTIITKTIEYSKSTPLKGLTKMLNNAIGREDDDNEAQEPNIDHDSSDITNV